MNAKKFQNEYDRIYSYFKTTTEPFNFLEWDGKILKVWNENEIVEKYFLKNLRKIVLNL